MKCIRCGAENEDNVMFCRSCGAELYTGENIEPKPETSQQDASSAKTKKKTELFRSMKKSKADGTALPEKKAKSPEKEKRRGANAAAAAETAKAVKRYIRITLIALAAAAAAAVIIILADRYSSSKGGRIAADVPLGRNIDFCIKETGEEFSATTQNRDLKSVSGFNYVCEADKTVSISGITVPRWAVLVSENSEGILDTVEYYNFAVLKNGWKGSHSSVRFTKETVSYGMDEKTVTKTIGFDPYYTKKTSDNKSVSCYRYYIIDNETGSERVFNYYVEFNDVNGTVVNAYDTEINYINYVLGIK